MGTDITAFIEAKEDYNDGNDGYETKAELFIDRAYDMFAIISNVRNCFAPPLEFVSEPKGLPDNLGVYTGTDNLGHSPSWLNVAEMEKAITIAEKLPEKWCVNELRKIVAIMKLYKEARLVFWYDC